MCACLLSMEISMKTSGLWLHPDFGQCLGAIMLSTVQHFEMVRVTSVIKGEAEDVHPASVA